MLYAQTIRRKHAKQSVGKCIDMKSISVSDLQLIPELSHLRMMDFINPAHTELIAPFLRTIGFDMDYPIIFQASQHRNLQGKIIIGYQLVGEVECNQAFLNSPWATAEDRMIAAGYRDLSLAQELANSMTLGMGYGSDDEGEPVDGFPADLTSPDEQVVLAQIKQLNDILLAVRGNPYKQDGSRATLFEHGIIEPLEKRRKKVATKKVAK